MESWAISGGGQWEKSSLVEGEALRAGSAEQRLPVGVCGLEVGGHCEARVGAISRGSRRVPGCAPLPDLTARVWRVGQGSGFTTVCS